MTTADSNPSVSQPAVQEIELGAESTFAELPYPLAIGQDDFFLVKDKGEAYHLLSAICPHSWGRIVRWDTCFMCPDHGWRFEMSEGICVNGPNARMPLRGGARGHDRLGLGQRTSPDFSGPPLRWPGLHPAQPFHRFLYRDDRVDVGGVPDGET